MFQYYNFLAKMKKYFVEEKKDRSLFMRFRKIKKYKF